ncbi:E3 ubiquitin-protein ligase WAV3 [Musa acuminata AAA Group]|uniref:E3 ubiquitin-protein ligase WAV3 n=1 Tax=Musa acuminata AAA Group TaxID=214697 RepID=UPI0031E45B14
MGGWRRAFCTSATVVARTEAGEKKQQKQIMGSSSPRSCAKLSFFSGGGGRGGNSPSTPRLALCRTSSESPDSSKLQCDKLPSPATASVNTSRKNRSPALFRRKALSTPSSPRSPSGFALFKQLSRSRCRICTQSLRASREMPVFTAECSHAFHLSCIAAHVRSMHGSLACPVCFATLRRAQLPSALHHQQEDAVVEQVLAGESENRNNPNRRATSGGDRNAIKMGERQLGQNRLTAAAVKVYDDDEPLLIVSTTNKGGGVRFNPIPEAANEDEDERGNDEDDLERKNKFRGLLATPPSPRSHGGGVPRRPTTRSRAGGVQVSMMPQAALLSEGRRHRNYVVMLKVKAPRMRPANLLSPAGGRTPIDLVTVLDVGQGMTADKLQMLKSKMRLVVSSMGPADRLSVVAFSAVAGAKRLLPLRRMSRQGQRAARQIVERLVVVGGGAPSGEEIVADALRKATKVLEDRRERNPVATIMLLSDARQQQSQDQGKEDEHNYHHTPLCSPRDAGDGDIRPHPLPMMTSAGPATSYAHLAIPLHAPGFGDGAAGPSQQKQKEESSEDSFMKCLGGLASLVMRDVRLQLFLPSGKISAVYPCGGGGGGGGGGCREEAPGEGSFVLHLGNLYAEEERELLVELRVPVSSSAASAPENSHHQLSVKCNYRDAAIQDVILDAEQILLLPPLLHSQAASSSSCSATSQWLRNLFVSTRALAESRRLADLSDYATAHHLLSSARSLLRQSACDAQDHGLIQNLEAELADLERRRLLRKQHQLPRHQEQQEESLSPSNRRRRRREPPAEVRGEQLTSTSAWRAAEQLAKVAIMRKSLNRVGDLHGFENARF